MSLQENLFNTTTCRDLAITIHGKKLHKQLIMVVNRRYLVTVLNDCQPKPCG